jgi:integrase
MAKAEKLPSGNWRVLVFDGRDENGKRGFSSFTAGTKKEAEYAAAEYALKKKRDFKPENMTVGDAIENYINSKDVVLSPATVRSYKGIRRNNFKSIMDVKLQLLTQELIQKAVNIESKNHAPKSIKNHYGLLTATLNQYMPDFNPKARLPQKEQTEIVIPTQDELNLILNDVRGTRLYIPTLLAAFLGLRRSEIGAVLWSDVDMINKKIKLSKAKVLNDKNEYIVKQPKSNAGYRTLDIPKILYDALKDIEIKEGNVSVCKPQTITNKFKRVVKRLGMPDVRFHDLRHYYASVMLALNIPDKYAMKRMGQSSNSTLKNVYQHIMKDKDKETTDKINDYFDDIYEEKE